MIGGSVNLKLKVNGSVMFCYVLFGSGLEQGCLVSFHGKKKLCCRVLRNSGRMYVPFGPQKKSTKGKKATVLRPTTEC